MPEKLVEITLPTGEKISVDQVETMLASAECIANIVAHILCEQIPYVNVFYYSLDTLDKVAVAWKQVGNIEALVTTLGAIPGMQIMEEYYRVAQSYERIAVALYSSYVDLLKSALDAFIQKIAGPWREILEGWAFIMDCMGIKMLFDFIEKLLSFIIEKVESVMFVYRRWLRSLEEFGKDKITETKTFDDILMIIRYIKARFQIACPGKLGL